MTRQPATEESAAHRSKPPLVLISANAFWNIANFRSGLIDALVERGYRVVIAAPGMDPDWARAHGAEAVDIKVDRSGLNPVRDARLFLDYLGLIRRNKPDFYLGFTIKPNIYGCLAGRMVGIRAVPNISGLGTAFMRDGLLSRFVGRLYRIALRDCPVVFFQNPDDRDQFLSRRIILAGQARLLPGSGVDLKRFVPAPPPDGPPQFLFVGRLLADKGVREFVDAAKLLKASEPSWRFQLVGPVDAGNRSGISDEELARWNAEGHVEYLGFSGDVREHVRSATAVVLPSYYREGVPRSLLEAAAMARPIIAANARGSRQIVEHGVNGLLCEPRSAQSLAEAMKQLGLMSDKEREGFGRAGRAKVEREFGEERVISAYLEAVGATPSRSERLT